MLIMKNTLKKNDLIFLKDVPMTNLNFTPTVIIVSEKKILSYRRQDTYV